MKTPVAVLALPRATIGTTMGGPLVGLVGMSLLPYEGGEALIAVQDNRAIARALFHERFQTAQELIPAFLEMKAVRPPQSP